MNSFTSVNIFMPPQDITNVFFVDDNKNVIS